MKKRMKNKKKKSLGAPEVSQEVNPWGGLEDQPRQTRISTCRRLDLAQSESIQEAGLDSGPQVRLEVERMVLPKVGLRNPAGGSPKAGLAPSQIELKKLRN